MTTRNTKGRTARKTAPKKAVKKPTKPVYVANSLEENFAAFVVKSFGGLTDKLEQIQRDIEQVRTLAHQTRTNSRANTVILNKTLAGVDFMKSGSSFTQEIAAHEQSEKLKKLVRGCRVDTPDGEGIYLGHDGSGEGRYPHWVSLARKDAPGTCCFNLDQLTPLT